MVYETVRCPSVCPSVCSIRPLQQYAAGLLLSARGVGDINCWTASAAAANAGRATFSAYVGR